MTVSPMARLAYVLDANVYANAENGSNVCAFGRHKEYSNQIWRYGGDGALQTTVHGEHYCMAGVVTPLALTATSDDYVHAPPVRNMSVVMEPCHQPGNAGDAQRWTLQPHGHDSFLSIVWQQDPRLCVTLTADGSPDIPGQDAHDVRLVPCHNGSSSGGGATTDVESALPTATDPAACADTAAGCAIYCQGIICEDGPKDAWPAWSFLSIDDGRTFRAVGEIETYGPTSFPSPRGDGATAVLPYVVFADKTRMAVLSNATAYSLDPASGVLSNYSFPVRLTFPKRIKTGPACNGGTCVNWWARRAIPLTEEGGQKRLLTMLGNLQFENDTHYSVASVVSLDGGYNWRLQTVISTGACLGTAPCDQDIIANAKTLEGPNEVDVVRLEDNSLLTVYRVANPGPYFHSR